MSRHDAPVTEDDIAFAGVRGQLELLTCGELTSRQLVDLLLARIERLDPQLGAFRVVLAERARADADAADRARARGDRRPLLGLPVAVKDDTDVAGVPTLLGAGSAEPDASADAPIVTRLRAAGAVVIGKTNLPELALWGFTASRWHGVTRNPWDTARTTGGSSGGSAAAVAAGLVPLATGSDGLGSLRIPAAACGLVTLKPSRGLIPQADAGWYGMSEVGLLARDVADLALGLEHAAGLAGQQVPTGLRIGWTLRAPVPVRLAPEVREAVQRAVAAAAALGCAGCQVTVGYGQRSGAASLVRTWLAGAARDRSRLADPAAVEPRTARLTSVGRRARWVLPWALREGDRLRARIDRIWEEADVLVLPATATLPPPADALEGKGLLRTMWLNARWGPFTGAFNASGHPAVVLPVRHTNQGVPVGVQLVGPHGSDALLIGLAGALEASLGVAGKRPPMG